MTLTTSISRRRLLFAAGAVSLSVGAPAMAGYDSAAKPANDRPTDANPATFTIAVADAPATGLAFWQAADALETLNVASRLLDDSRWQGSHFVAAAFYSALDGKRAAFYGQWASGNACQNGLHALSGVARVKPSEAGVFAIADRFPAGTAIPIRAVGIAGFREYWTNSRRQDELISRECRAEAEQAGDEGILAASVHRATKGRRVVSYLQIDDAHAQSVRNRWSESANEHLQGVERVECRLYDIVFVMANGGRPTSQNSLKVR